MNFIKDFVNQLSERMKSPSSWINGIGAVLSTVIGIAMTFGTTAYLNRCNEQEKYDKLVKNVLVDARSNLKTAIWLDSIFTAQTKAYINLSEKYDSNRQDMSQVPDISLFMRFDQLKDNTNVLYSRSLPEKYFDTPEVFQLFDNPTIYANFILLLELGKQVFAAADELVKEEQEIAKALNYKMRIEHKQRYQVAEELFTDRLLSDAYADTRVMYKQRVLAYQNMIGVLMKLTNTTLKDLNEYAQSIEEQLIKLTDQERDLLHEANHQPTDNQPTDHSESIFEDSGHETIQM